MGAVRVALVGSGRMGSVHGATVAHRLRTAELAAFVDASAPGRPHRSPARTPARLS